MVRIRFIQNPETKEIQWKYARESETSERNDKKVSKDSNLSAITIETSKGFVYLNTHPKSGVGVGNQIIRDTKDDYLQHRMRDIPESKVILGHIWVRVRPKTVVVGHVPVTIPQVAEMYDPIKQEWIEVNRYLLVYQLSEIHRGIVKYVLSEMEKAEADHEFHKKERASVEETFDDLCKSSKKEDK
jgi:hypothetical protein